MQEVCISFAIASEQDPSVAAASRGPPAASAGEPPSWLRGGAAQPPPPPPVAQAVPVSNGAPLPTRAAAPQPARAASGKVPQVILFTRLTNMALCVLLSATAVVELLTIPYTYTSEVELFDNASGVASDHLQLFSCETILHQQHFNSILGYISAVAMLVNAVFNFYVIFKYPEIEEQQHRK
eukprot:11578-Heterococcus_DN1.PRE.2